MKTSTTQFVARVTYDGLNGAMIQDGEFMAAAENAGTFEKLVRAKLMTTIPPQVVCPVGTQIDIRIAIQYPEPVND